MRYYRKIV